MSNGTSSGGAPITPSSPQAFLNPSATGGTDFNFYSTSVSGLVSPTTQSSATPLQSQLQITASWDFYWVASTYMVDIAGGSDPEEESFLMPRILVTIQDSGSGRLITPSPVPLPTIAGPGERPYRLILPRLIRATSVFNFTWTAYGSPSSSTTYNYVYFILHGFVVPAGAPYPF